MHMNDAMEEMAKHILGGIARDLLSGDDE